MGLIINFKLADKRTVNRTTGQPRCQRTI